MIASEFCRVDNSIACKGGREVAVKAAARDPLAEPRIGVIDAQCQNSLMIGANENALSADRPKQIRRPGGKYLRVPDAQPRFAVEVIDGNPGQLAWWNISYHLLIRLPQVERLLAGCLIDRQTKRQDRVYVVTHHRHGVCETAVGPDEVRVVEDDGVVVARFREGEILEVTQKQVLSVVNANRRPVRVEAVRLHEVPMDFAISL